ncbi:MAG: acetyl-CoA carboxylase biotin carboxyl carrier protein [Candidatus Margulisbacteria bacterium]|nr:acetyl-CoA carboxylase biotin carboxyl carrier protein [Candidatus Margulisiibacteriota bacterium]
MDLKEIKRLVQLVEEANISHLSIDSDGTKIEIKKELGHAPFPHQYQTHAIHHAPVAPALAPVEAEPVDSNAHLTPIKAQMVGTFYGSPSPDAPQYVKVGDRIKEGQVICIIEAMKLFNEIEADQSGVVEKICVSSGNAVEFGQPMFLVRPE